MAGGIDTSRLRGFCGVSAERWVAGALVFALIGLDWSASAASAQAADRSNRNVRTWTWSREVVQPEINSISRLKHPGRSVQQITRQLLGEARKLAENGDFRGAVELARRADSLSIFARQTSTLAWDPSEQTPASFLRQLEMVHVQRPQLRQPRSQSHDGSPGRVRMSQTEPPGRNRWQSKQSAEGSPSTTGPSVFDSRDVTDQWSPLRGDSGGLTPRTGNAETIAEKTPDGGEEPHRPDAEQAAAVMPPLRLAGDDLEAPAEAAVAHSDPPSQPATPQAVVVPERIVHVAPVSEAAAQSIWTAAFVQLISTAVGLILGILLLVAVRAYVKRKYGADFGFIFRVEHVGAGGMMYYSSPDETNILPFPTTSINSGRDGASAVLTDLPEGFMSTELSPYEEELRAAEEAEREMMKHVLEQNLKLRQEIGEITKIAA